jgi:3-mercaptopyruvate sulfurtransferase SseA
MTNKATRPKIICPKCHKAYYGSHKVALAMGDVQAWIDKGYKLEDCVSCRSRASYLAFEKRFEASLIKTDPDMVISQQKGGD